MTDLRIEDSLPFQEIAGVDEVGRGPWAGPVTAAAVILDPANIPEGLRDSKMLTPARRDVLYQEIMATARVGIGTASVTEIDEINILSASLLAMSRAIHSLPALPEACLIDGNRAPRDVPVAMQTVVKGDARSSSIAAASIVAKVTRDREMVALADTYPAYDWANNKGYGTASHRLSLLRNGVTPHHRRSFAPIYNMLFQEDFLND